MHRLACVVWHRRVGAAGFHGPGYMCTCAVQGKVNKGCAVKKTSKHYEPSIEELDGWGARRLSAPPGYLDVLRSIE